MKQENLGITRYPSGFMVRVGWKNAKPLFQQQVGFAKFQNEDKAFNAAKKIRDKALKDLEDQGILKRQRRSSHYTKKNKSGIPGMTLQTTASKAGEGVFYSWKVNWKESGSPMGRTFAFSTYGNSWNSYVAAANCRLSADLRVYGSSPVDIGQLEDLYLQACINYGLLPETERKAQ